MKSIVFIYFFLIVTPACVTKQSRFVTEQQHQEDIEKLREYNADKLRQLSKYGVDENSDVSLLFYFTTDDSAKLKPLSDELRKRNHHVNEMHQSPKDKTLWVLSANSSEVKMDSASVNKWTTALCELGYQYDCAMQGWNPVSE